MIDLSAKPKTSNISFRFTAQNVLSAITVIRTQTGACASAIMSHFQHRLEVVLVGDGPAIFIFERQLYVCNNPIM